MMRFSSWLEIIQFATRPSGIFAIQSLQWFEIDVA